MNIGKCSIVVLFSIALFYGEPYAAGENPSDNLKKLIFEERKIEGKIRRPQLVLIKVEQRPEFEPMVIQSLGRTADIAGSVETDILDKSPYGDAFKFKRKKIVNYIP